MWVRATPELLPPEVPGLKEDQLRELMTPGGSVSEKLQAACNIFRQNARHLESLQQVLRRKFAERQCVAAPCDALPSEVQSVVAEAQYLDSFLSAFDGQIFPVHSEECVPGHEYCLALEVQTGGKYWSSIPTQDDVAVRHHVETVTASSPVEGSASVISQFGAAQRGAVFVWRWKRLEDKQYEVPEWLAKALEDERSDPLQKLQVALDSLTRWENEVRQETAQHIKQPTELKDPYIREVLRLWPCETDSHGCQSLKKCAWVEGLDPNLFTARKVTVHRVSYDAHHSLILSALIARRHVEEPPQEGDPPYRLTTTWQWAPSAKSAVPELALPAATGIPSERD